MLNDEHTTSRNTAMASVNRASAAPADILLDMPACLRTSLPRSNGPLLSMKVIGGFELWLDDMRVENLPRGKTRSLLKLLLLRRHGPLSRTRLCNLYWPEADAGSARNSLHVTLHRVRRALDPAGVIVHQDEGYQFLPNGPVWIDSEQFLQRSDMGALLDARGKHVEAIAHYEASLVLHGLDQIDEDSQDAALSGLAQQLRDRHNQVLQRLAELHEAAGDLHACLRTALRHLSLDACNEAAHGRLMRCYAALGQPQLAERQYRTCVRVLRETLGVAPQEVTTRLYRLLTSREVSAADIHANGATARPAWHALHPSP
ncbi:AfsR/SARP family transcriptional regulator [Sphaerotilus mobilis]|uniref:DNA-binding SARP family transcriptional activator n=1 Tax=Sphaerotilus mobilis TaxID=47994 RepID=A0A4V2EVR3_9BURK|nr:BTAD domain-containing putative transcriptional regulator [Sphaerotilus mobilis]RZS53390.1 DNA-binding SARP family transcriptional activator [Sphaerotilus mobilis]